MDNSSLAHTKWKYKYHIVFAPKYRRQIVYGKIKADIGTTYLLVMRCPVYRWRDSKLGQNTELGNSSRDDKEKPYKCNPRRG